MQRRAFLVGSVLGSLGVIAPASAREAYHHHSLTGRERFFWDAEAEPYPTKAPWFRDPAVLRREDLDPAVAELVLRMNRLPWLRTCTSCAGHPEQDEAYAAHPEVWVRIVRPEDVGLLFAWLARARARRQALSPVFRSDPVLFADFVGQTRHGLYFALWGQFVSTAENARILRALGETLG